MRICLQCGLPVALVADPEGERGPMLADHACQPDLRWRRDRDGVAAWMAEPTRTPHAARAAEYAARHAVRPQRKEQT